MTRFVFFHSNSCNNVPVDKRGRYSIDVSDQRAINNTGRGRVALKRNGRKRGHYCRLTVDAHPRGNPRIFACT